MIDWLLCCDHRRVVLTRANASDALREFGCKKCVTFDLENERWRYRDIRVYLATADDKKTVSPPEPKGRPPVKVPVEQLDWVGL